MKYPNMEALNDAGHLFGRPLREALADGLIDGSIQITNVSSQMSKGSLPELSIGFVVLDEPGRTPPELPVPQIPVTLDLKPGDICPVCAGLGVTCVYCEGEGVVIDREHYDPLPKDGGWGNRWATAGVQASGGSGGVLTKPPPPPPRPTHGKRVLPAVPTVNVQPFISPPR